MWRYTLFVVFESESDDLGSVTRLEGTDDSRVHGLDMGSKVRFEEAECDVGQTTRILVTREIADVEKNLTVGRTAPDLQIPVSQPLGKDDLDHPCFLIVRLLSNSDP